MKLQDIIEETERIGCVFMSNGVYKLDDLRDASYRITRFNRLTKVTVHCSKRLFEDFKNSAMEERVEGLGDAELLNLRYNEVDFRIRINDDVVEGGVIIPTTTFTSSRECIILKYDKNE